MNKQDWIIGAIIAVMATVVVALFGIGKPATAKPIPATDHLRAAYHELHFKPAAETATDEQCLACHREIIEDRVRVSAPAGVKASDSLAWYQTLSTYTGEQETFHRRHLLTPLARQLMNLQCNTCHDGLDPREEAQGSSATSPVQSDTGFALRKQVNPETTCLKCHGQMNWQVMGLPGPWQEVHDQMGNDCLVCHANIRTSRHNVSYLNAAAIEAAGKDNADVCHGCHGGRAWYRISYPYPRHPWPNMPADTPDWAKDRPGYSEPRFAQPSALNRFLQPTP
jgi:hypothetical protein